MAAGPQLSYDGKISFWASSERSSKEQFGLLAIDTKTGEKIAELWDGPDSSLDYQSAITSPIKDDYRILTGTNRTGVERLLTWNPHSGERVDLDIDLTGLMRAFDWSPNGERILFALSITLSNSSMFTISSGAHSQNWIILEAQTVVLTSGPIEKFGLIGRTRHIPDAWSP